MYSFLCMNRESLKNNIIPVVIADLILKSVSILFKTCSLGEKLWNGAQNGDETVKKRRRGK